MCIDLSLSNRSSEFNIASISNNSQKERTNNQTPEIAAADDKGRRNAVPSADEDNNLKGSSLVRLQNQVYIPLFHGCDFDVPVDIRNSKGVKVCFGLNGRSNRSGEKLTTGQPEIPPAEEPTSSGHPREATATTESPEDFGGPITRTQETTGTPKATTTGAEAVARMEKTTLTNLERTANLGDEPTRTPDSTRRHTRSHGPVPEHPWIRQSRI
ncbi:hypothetical protein JTB14_020588 [Gonioctena quinquepunctata]|nr:hypothetical protein JTB14_020588 [Gonioctena quinquepunctata]